MMMTIYVLMLVFNNKQVNEYRYNHDMFDIKKYLSVAE